MATEVGSTIWLAALTLLVVILLAITFRNWRRARRSRSSPTHRDSLTASLSVDSTSVQLRCEGPDMFVEEVDVTDV